MGMRFLYKHAKTTRFFALILDIPLGSIELQLGITAVTADLLIFADLLWGFSFSVGVKDRSALPSGEERNVRKCILRREPTFCTQTLFQKHPLAVKHDFLLRLSAL
jgi:hypothetical protein